MKPHFYDTINRFLRSFSGVKFNALLEGVTIQCDIEPQLQSLSFVFSLGRLQACSLSEEPTLRISGTMPQWLELFANPLSPQNGCSIQGRPEYWQVIRNDMLQFQDHSKIFLQQYPCLRSSIFGFKTLFSRALPDNPFLTKSDFLAYQNTVRALYHQVDQCEWQLERMK